MGLGKDDFSGFVFTQNSVHIFNVFLLKANFSGFGFDEVKINFLYFDVVFLSINKEVQRLCSSMTKHFKCDSVIFDTVFHCFKSGL